MSVHVILASGSTIRAELLLKAGLDFQAMVPRIDEEAIKSALISDGAPPREIADTLAEMKARKISDKFPEAFVIGCDQVLDLKGTLFSKPDTQEDARAQLVALRGHQHMLLSAAVIYQSGEPIWRHVGQVRLRMRTFSDSYLDSYICRNWNSIRHSVGSYKIEEEGVRLFSSIDGDHFNVMGMPLLQLLNFLTLRGVIEQ
jgi:septum formation protein